MMVNLGAAVNVIQAIRTHTAQQTGCPTKAAPAGAANTSCSGASPFKTGRTYRDGTP